MNVLIADKFDDRGVSALRDAGCEIVLDPALRNDALTKALADTAAEILIVRSTKVSAAMLEASAKLKLVIRAGSGYDTIDFAAAAEKNIRVCNCPGMNSVAVAELALGLMIALDRRIVDQTVDLRRGVWNKKEFGKARGLKGRALGIVGMGRIGYEIARRAHAFDMKLLYCDIVDRKDVEQELGAVKVPFEQLLADGDFVTLHVPGSADTKHLVGAKELALMKPTAFLLNCSRGGIIDERALRAAIESGKLAGAALDVYETEPAATDTKFTDPVIQTSRVYGTHHVGASTEQAQSAVAEEAVRIVKAYAETNEFLNCVNL